MHEHISSPFESDILDDYFNEPLIHVDSRSSVGELENAVFRLKHMVLASTNEPEEKRQRLLDRLIELRRILHTVKDSTGTHYEPNECLSDGSESHIPTAQTDTRSPLVRCVRTASQHSLPIHVHSPESRQLKSSICSTGGHDFKLISAFRYLGQSCEYCRSVIRDPSRRILVCMQCPVICHSQHCLRGLTRRCPCSLYSSDLYANLKPPSQPAPHAGHQSGLLRSTNFRHLEVRRLCYVGANLTDQCWSCFECHMPLQPAPNNTVTAERPLTGLFISKTDSVMENTASLLMRQAVRAESNPDEMLKWVSPQLQTQVNSLWNQTDQILSVHPKISVPTDKTGPHLQWAYADAQTDLGPIQTWADAVVLEAINHIPRVPNKISQRAALSACHFRTPFLLNGEIVRPPASPEPGSDCLTNGPQEQSSDQARLCYYTGQFYCARCHWGDSHPIPACIFTLGDYRPKPVCRSALLWLQYTWSRHLFRVPDPWYQYEPQAQTVAALRIRIFRFKPYLDICDRARSVWSELNSHDPYWVLEQPYTFTMKLVDSVINGTFASKLERCLRFLDEHVRSCPKCESCVPPQCSVCEKGPIRPYDPLISFCSECHRPCHRSCLACPLPVSINDIPSAVPAHSTDADDIDDVLKPAGASVRSSDFNTTNLLELLYPAMRTICLSCGCSEK
ncbi:hypothetical protein FGIG_07431 [Fasciola gigantica]|uniref:Phorbol-ester/DAG-type domain-containing protein n=1 Tax=Fasciola gigantica TaxID=46835 RepID=A0A504YIA3_FASGI|nr:hypothetical protein FGIG_07431 [Fasciola gigantica]